MRILSEPGDVGGYVAVIEDDGSGDGLAGKVVARNRDGRKLFAELEERRAEFEKRYPGKLIGIAGIPDPRALLATTTVDSGPAADCNDR